MIVIGGVRLLETITAKISGYPGLMLFCSASGLAVPVPEDVALIWAGIQVGSGTFQWAPTIAAALVGVQIRDLAAFGIGRLLGDTLLDSQWARRLVGRRKIARAQRLVVEHGAAAVLLGRFFVGFRAPMFMVAGAMRLPLREFLRWDLLGLLFTVPGVIALGYEFGEPLLIGTRWALAQSRVLMVTGIGIGGVVLLWRHSRAASEPPTSEL